MADITSTLIPIKGISKSMNAKLLRKGVIDSVSLLTHCIKADSRSALAKELNVDVKLVNSWIKQADLMRVKSMNNDMAYLISLTGVRCPEDLAKVDPKKLWNALQSLSYSIPDSQLCEYSKVEELIENAGNYVCSTYEENPLTFISREIKSISRVERLRQRAKLIDKRRLRKRYLLDARKIDLVLSVEWDIEEPKFLYFDEDSETSLIKEDQTGKVIKYIKDNLEDFDNYVLPLPRTITGSVFHKGLSTDTDEETTPFVDARVEVLGAVSPNSDHSAEDNENSVYGITDSLGLFRITMPERYCLKETVTFKITKDSGRQIFIKSASEILDSIKGQADVNNLSSALFYARQIVNYDRTKASIDSDIRKFNEAIAGYDGCIRITEENQKNILSNIENIKNSKTDKAVILNEDDETSQQRIRELIESSLKRVKASSRNEILNIDTLSKDILTELNKVKDNCVEEAESIVEDSQKTYTEKIINMIALELSNSIISVKDQLDKIIAESSIEAKLIGSAPFNEATFIVTDAIFNNMEEKAKTLPSVRLMGGDDDDKVVELKSDTAPSRIFNYCMLQRLVAPAISGEEDRKTLSEPVDIEEFRDKIKADPKGYPQATTLGLGYTLNMHQAWVPDGFALGSLLYSLVLAPGEEQRLIVRENKQKYSLSDEASAIDTDSQSYEMDQTDDSEAAYNYALNQLTQASSSYQYKVNTGSFGASYGQGLVGSGIFKGITLGLSSMFGLSGGTSTTKGSGSSSARQSNSHNESSQTAQSFQHSIKNVSNRISQAKRISISTATSEEGESVATKIIANHNHSHAMTIQYWEVMRRYRMETCIDSVDLVLFVPTKLISFLPTGESDTLNPQNFNKDRFINRYKKIHQYSTDLRPQCPSNLRTGIDLINKYFSKPNWILRDLSETASFTLEIKGNFLEYDDLSFSLVLKNGKGTIAGFIEEYDRKTVESLSDKFTWYPYLNKGFATTLALKDKIKKYRDKASEDVEVKVNFMLPSDVTEEDISYIKIYHNYQDLNYTLKDTSGEGLTDEQKEAYKNFLGKLEDFAKDDNKSSYDMRKMSHYSEILPENYLKPQITVSAQTLKSLGAPTISQIKIQNAQKEEDNEDSVSSNMGVYLTSNTLTGTNIVKVSCTTAVMKTTDLQQMEETLQHVISNPLLYSQCVWASLSSDERTMLLENYTIDMSFSPEFAAQGFSNEGSSIALLDCINVKRLLGFYGNCMLFPLTYPEKLAKAIGKTAKEIQDNLYNYHTNNFRVPTTTISLPTEGMVGEAVLGNTNVSEKIDITRFWNWQDSPIDSMTLDSSYLNSTDYLAGKTTKDVTSINVQGANAPTAMSVPDLVSALISKQTPTFENITGLEQLKEVLNAGTSSATTGLTNAITASKEISQSALQAANDAHGRQMNLQTEKTKAASSVLSNLLNSKDSNGNSVLNGLSGDNKSKLLSSLASAVTGENVDLGEQGSDTNKNEKESTVINKDSNGQVINKDDELDDDIKEKNVDDVDDSSKQIETSLYEKLLAYLKDGSIQDKSPTNFIKSLGYNIDEETIRSLAESFCSENGITM